MNKKIMLTLIVGIFMFSLVSSFSFDTNINAIPTVEKGEAINLTQYCPTCTFVNISSVIPPSNIVEHINTEMIKNGSTFTYSYSNTDVAGEYLYFVEGDKGGLLDGETLRFIVTPYGSNLSIQDSLVRMFLILFFMVLLILTYFLTSKTDFKKWNESIIKKYQNRNIVKMTLSALFYNIMKNSYVIYYLFGLPIVMIITDLTYVYNITGFIVFMQVFLYIYLIGVTIVGLIWLSYVQEWIYETIEIVKNLDWGIN